jgi:hypothetical protein
LEQLVPSDEVLLSQCCIDGVVISGGKFFIWDGDFVFWEFEMLFDARCNTYAVGMVVSADQGFEEELDSVFAGGVLVAVEEMVLVFVVGLAAWAECYGWIFYFCDAELLVAE